MTGNSTARRRPTGADVARLAKVSRATVSYVLSEAPGQTIPEATRQRVREAARSLGYAPSTTGRSPRPGRSSDIVVGLLPGWPIGDGIGDLLDQLSQQFSRLGLTFLIDTGTLRSATDPSAWQALTPAAVLTFTPLTPAEHAAVEAAGVNLIHSMFAPVTEPGSLLTDERRAGELQVEHLHHLGHRRIAYAAPDDPRLSPLVEARSTGVRLACEERDLPAVEVLEVPVDPAAAASALVHWTQQPDPVTAIAAFNDQIALALLAGAHRLGLEPGAVSVIGMDDIPAARTAIPSLTTVHRDLRLTAVQIVAAIHAGLGDGTSGRPRISPAVHRVVARESTTPPPVRERGVRT